MYPSYKTRKAEFRQLFPDCHKDKFVVDYSCAYHKDILHQVSKVWRLVCPMSATSVDFSVPCQPCLKTSISNASNF